MVLSTDPDAGSSPDPTVDPGRGRAALIGMVAASAGLGAGELAAGLVGSWPSPVEAVGDRFIDATPAWLKDLAIGWFGTGHRRALTIAMLLVVTVLAAAATTWARYRPRRIALAGGIAALIASVVVLSAPDVDASVTLDVVIPVVLAAAVAVIVATRLLRVALVPGPSGAGIDRPADRIEHSSPETSPRAESTTRSRRAFLVTTGAVLAAGVATAGLGRALGGRFSNAAQRAAVVLAPPWRRRPPVPPDPAVAGISPLITPTGDFFRIDTAFTVPRIDPGDWRLRIHGLVEREIVMTYDELMAREQIEADITLACVSNEVGGDLVGTARWQGVRLDTLLAEAGIEPGADQVLGRSSDGFTAGFPVAVLDGRDAIVALAMNGEILPNRHGFPARLVVPGLYGYVSATKWLAEIELTRFDLVEGYWISRGWSREGPVKLQSRIDTPRGTVDAGPVAVAGVAWAPATGIAAVEVQIDDGPWRPATLGGDLGIDSWRQWWISWDATPGRHRIRCRAIDTSGAVQTEQRTPVAPDGATGWHTRTVTVAT